MVSAVVRDQMRDAHIPKIPAYRIGDFVQEYTRRVDYSKAANNGDILRKNILRVRSRVQKSSLISDTQGVRLEYTHRGSYTRRT